jgi:resuscitation-promoting factor RpfB
MKPGWYPDPDRPGQQRWWDGEHWRGEGAAVGPPGESTPDSYALASLVTALLVIPVVPIWLGLRARTRIRESGGTRDGLGIALIGIVFGIVETVALAVLLVALLAG